VTGQRDRSELSNVRSFSRGDLPVKHGIIFSRCVIASRWLETRKRGGDEPVFVILESITFPIGYNPDELLC